MWGSRFTLTEAIAQKSRIVEAPRHEVWRLIEDPAQLARWWPGVTATEDLQPDRWTEVHGGKRGGELRLGFRLRQSDAPSYRLWEQELAGTPFERVLSESMTELALEPVDGGTLVTIATRQKLRGYSRTGARLIRRATAKQLGEALDGLQRLFG